MISRSKHVPRPLTTPTQHCPHCAHVLVPCVTEHGQRVILDTRLTATWCFTGRESAEGLPIVAPSRGYLVHPQPCQGEH